MKTSKLRVTYLCAENSPVTGEFPEQMASNAENVSIWWRHHDMLTEYDDTTLVLAWFSWSIPVSTPWQLSMLFTYIYYYKRVVLLICQTVEITTVCHMTRIKIVNRHAYENMLKASKSSSKIS